MRPEVGMTSRACYARGVDDCPHLAPWAPTELAPLADTPAGG